MSERKRRLRKDREDFMECVCVCVCVHMHVHKHLGDVGLRASRGKIRKHEQGHGSVVIVR